ncbi:tumor protein 63-like isoform X2 [Haemaphysalis longicornis]
MDNALGVGDGMGDLECSPLLPSLSPDSQAAIDKVCNSGSYKNVWQLVNNSLTADQGLIQIDNYSINPANLDVQDGLMEANSQEVVTFSRPEELLGFMDGGQQQQQLLPQPEPPRLPIPEPEVFSALPATSAYEGNYGFDVTCPTRPKSAKGVDWTYAEPRRKLYTTMGTACPFHVRVGKRPPSGTVVRAMAVYAEPNDAMHVVRRCLVHAAQQGQGLAPLAHFIHSDSTHAEYHEDPATGRHSLTMLYEAPQAGQSYTQYLLRFTCLSSCQTGINRRAVKIIWTLEHGGSVLGRQSISLKVCACPGRDRRNEEKAAARELGQGILEPATNHTVPSLTRKRGLMTTAITGGPVKLRKVEKEKEYTLTCPDRETYNMLKFIRDATMCYSLTKPHVRKTYQDIQCSPAEALADRLDAAASRPGCSTSPCTEAASQLAGMKVENGIDVTSGPGSLQCWLESIGLHSCFPILLERSIRDISSLKQMTFRALKRLRLRDDQEATLIGAMRTLDYDDEDEELFPSQDWPSQGSGPTSSQQSCSSSTAVPLRVTRVRILHPIRDHDYS